MTPEPIPTSSVRIPAVPAPRWLSNWRVWVGGLLLLLIPFFVPIPSELRRHPVIGTLGDQLHTVLLCALTFLLYWRGPLVGRLGLSVLVTAIIGGSIEFLQILVGRAALFHDFVLDLVGIGLAAGFILWRGHQSRLGLTLMVLLLVYIPFQLRELPYLIEARMTCEKQFPLLTDFESPHDLQLWDDSYLSEISIQTRETPESEGSSNLFLQISIPASEKWPGAVMRHFPADWSQHSELALDIRLNSDTLSEIRGHVRLDDFAGRRDNVWTHDHFKITEQWQTVRIPLKEHLVAQKSRVLDLTDMVSLTIFVSTPDQPLALDVDNVRLH